MNNKHDQPSEELGLLASGSSGRWSVEVDEVLGGEEWLLEIDGPQVYLVFQLKDLAVPQKALCFLESELQADRSGGRHEQRHDDALILGWFGSASVSLLRDNEDFPRCFLVVGPRAQSTLRLSLGTDDMQMLAEALRQVVEGVPQTS